MSAHRSAPDELTSLLRPDYDTGIWVVEIQRANSCLAK